jgi:hypothetical protein
MSRHRRLIVLLVIFSLVAGLVLFDDPGKRHAAPAIATALAPQSQSGRAAVVSSLQQSGEPLTMLTLRPRRAPESATGNAFVQRDWTPPPPPPPPPPPAPPVQPQPPLLPFLFLGKQVAGNQWTVFLAHQDRTYVIVVGDVIEDTYRVDSIEPPLLSLTYLPLKQQQTLSIGAIQ